MRSERVANNPNHPQSTQLPVPAAPSHGNANAYSEALASDAAFRALVESALDAVLIADDSGRYREANRAACELFGLSKRALLSKKVVDVVVPDREGQTEQLWGQFLERGTMEGEVRIVRSDGETRDVEFRATANFVPGLHLSVLRDVTERKRLEEQVRAQADELQGQYSLLASLVDSVDVALSMMDAEGRYTMVNRAWEQRTGFSRRDALGKRFTEISDPTQLTRYVDAIDHALTSGEPTSFRDLFAQTTRRPEGFYIDWALHPLKDPDGNVSGLLSVSIEVTDRVYARQEIESQRLVFETILEAAPIGVILYDREMRIVTLNTEYARLARRVPSEVIGKTAYELSPLAEKRRPIYERVLAGESIEDSLTYEFPDGDVHHFDVRYRPVRDSEGNVTGILSTMLDVTEQKKSAEEVELQRALFETIFEQAPVGLALFDTEMRFLSMNSEFARMGRYDPISSIGHTIYEVRPSTRERQSIHERVLAGESIDLENFVTPDLPSGGRTNYYDIRYRPVHDAEGNVTGMLVAVVDVTVRKELDQQKDEFIALASHELKTPITAIKGFADMSSRTATRIGNERLARMLTVINQQSDRLTRLINDLLEVSRLQSGTLALDLDHFDLRDLVQEAAFGQGLVAPDFAISVSLPQELAPVKADRQRLEQVVANLVSNAVKYSGDSRRVEVEVSRQGIEVITLVRDYGLGIPADEQDLVFDRFFRARNVRTHYHTGLGLGLFIAYGIIERHGGRVWLESVENEGSTFYFSLPLAEG